MITKERIKEILAEWSGKNIDEINEKTSLIDDLETDSLGVVEIMMIFEEELDIVIPNEDIDKISNVGDIISYLERKVN